MKPQAFSTFKVGHLSKILVGIALSFAATRSRGEAGFGARAVASTPDGKLILMGYVGDEARAAILLLRLDAAGHLDATFGKNGVSQIPVAPPLGTSTTIFLYPDGQIALASTIPNGANTNLEVLRLTPAGLPQTGPQGRVKIPLQVPPEIAQTFAVQPDGKFLVGGTLTVGGKFKDLAVARLAPNGVLDTSFGKGGVITTRISGQGDRALAVAGLKDGRVVVAGEYIKAGKPQMLVARYQGNGQLDPSFNKSGGAFIDWSTPQSSALALSLASDGSVFVTGDAQRGTNGRLTLAKYLPDGSLDPNFGEAGKVNLDVSPGDDRGVAVVSQTTGRVVVFGDMSEGGKLDLVALRFLPNGKIDESFAEAGKNVFRVSSRNPDTFKKFSPFQFQLNGAMQFDTALGTMEFGGELAWTPQVRFSRNFGMRLSGGALIYTDPTVGMSLIPEYQAFFVVIPVAGFGIEAGGGLQDWMVLMTQKICWSVNFAWRVGEIASDPNSWKRSIDRVFVGVTGTLDNAALFQFKLGVAFDI